MSRLEREDQLVQKAMRKKSRKVRFSIFRNNHITTGVTRGRLPGVRGEEGPVDDSERNSADHREKS